MADRNAPDVDDLDDVFDALTRDVDHRTLPRGADRAVHAAGRRRALTGVGFVAALVIVAGIGAGILAHRPTAELPVAGPSTSVSAASTSDDGSPGPARLTRDRLNQATRGWTTWRVDPMSSPARVPCLRDNGADPELVGQQIELFASSDGMGGVSLQRLRFTSRDASNRAMLPSAQQLTTGVCPQQTGAYNTDITADLEVVAANWKVGDRRGTTFLINHGDRMDVLTVTGLTLPDDVYEKLSSLIAADVEVP